MCFRKIIFVSEGVFLVVGVEGREEGRESKLKKMNGGMGACLFTGREW